MTKATAKDGAKIIQMRVEVHGLFAFVIHDGYLDLVTPILDEHVIAAGRAHHEVLLQRGNRYILSGPNSCANPTVDAGHIQVWASDSGISSVDPNREKFCCIRMPVPLEINVKSHIRIVKPDPPPPIFVGAAVDQNSLNTKTVPTITELVYEVKVPDTASNTDKEKSPLCSFGDFWEWSGNPDDYLIVWAEPAFNTHSDHASMAFNMLVGMFAGLDLDVNPAADLATWVTPTKSSKKKSPFPSKFSTLAERCGVKPLDGMPCMHLDVVHVRTCFSMVVDSK